MKTCTKCNIIKDESEFEKQRNVCRECRRKYNQKYHKDNKIQISNRKKITGKKYNLENRDVINEKHKVYYQLNKSKIILKRKKYYQINKKKILDHEKYKFKNNINFSLAKRLRIRLWHALNGYNKSKSTLKLLGCTIKELKIYLQNTAINNGYLDFDIEKYSGKEYHIDHIIPCSYFDLSKEEEQQKCFHYSNLQILTAQDNLQKSDKL